MPIAHFWNVRQRLNFTNHRDPDRRTGHMIVEGGNAPGAAYYAHWDTDGGYSGYGFGATSLEACKRLAELTEEWIKDGMPKL
jgi:hypothetical protein